jgi:cytoskeletal protein RodZ
MNISWILRAWRCHEGLSVAEAAKIIGIPHNSLRCLEQGKGIRGSYWIILDRWLTDIR